MIKKQLVTEENETHSILYDSRGMIGRFEHSIYYFDENEKVWKEKNNDLYHEQIKSHYKNKGYQINNNLVVEEIERKYTYPYFWPIFWVVLISICYLLKYFELA